MTPPSSATLHDTPGAGGLCREEPVPALPTNLTLTKLSVAPNPTGLVIAFGEAHGNQANTLQTIGKRPAARVGWGSAAKTALPCPDWNRQ